jgi:hypothetical protein
VKTILVLVCVCGPLALASRPVEAADAARTLPLRGTLQAAYNPTKCPTGTPVLTNGSVTPCYLVIAHGTIPSLGKTADRRIAIILHSTTKCPEVKFEIVLTAAKGTLHASAAKRCLDPQADVRALPFTITGGTGAFVNATGSGTITVRDSSAGYGFETETWHGTVTLPK